MGRHIATGQLVAIKQTNLDECTEEELLQLLVGSRSSSSTVSVSQVPHSDLCLETQNEVLLSRLFRHPNLLTSRLVFSSCCQLWVLAPLMAYGQPPPNLPASGGTQWCASHCIVSSLAFSRRLRRQLTEDLFPGRNERIPDSVPAVRRFESIGIPPSNGLRAPVCEEDRMQIWPSVVETSVISACLLRSGCSGVKASHILLSGEGRVYLSGLHSVYSMMREGRRMRVVFDMPHHSPALLPWLSPELLRQVRNRLAV